MESDLAAAALGGLADRRVLAVAVLRGGRIVWASPALLAMFGLDGDVAGEPRLLDLVAPADREALSGALEIRPGTEVGPRSFTGLRADGSQFDAELIGCTLELPGGPGVAIALSDVTVQRRAQAQLSYLALRDPLTELPNRALFFDRLRQALVGARRHGNSFAVLVSDLDGFKLINDRYGHETGDALLQVAAKRLRAATREGDTVARIGGDEFSALLARASTPEDAAIVARRMVQALDQPIVIAGQPCQVGISIGIALYPAGGKDMDVLVAHADGAMYAAKRAGGRCYKFAGERDADISGPLRLPFFEWSEAHSVGVPLMDAQHKELAGLINRIGEDLKAGHDAERLHESFARLVEAARAHFATEEQLMASAGLGAPAERHKQEHRRLIEELESQADAIEGRSMSLTMRYLNFWLLHHIESTDMHQAKQLIEAPVGKPIHESPTSRSGRELERWHRAVRRGLWVAPEPRSISPEPTRIE
jgi:diguanylate cyclase (GGDEF)-like protein/hemerythrin-like metal-binding protein/PAS domain S-box-containing protein